MGILKVNFPVLFPISYDCIGRVEIQTRVFPSGLPPRFDNHLSDRPQLLDISHFMLLQDLVYRV